MQRSSRNASDGSGPTSSSEPPTEIPVRSPQRAASERIAVGSGSSASSRPRRPLSSSACLLGRGTGVGRQLQRVVDGALRIDADAA